MTIPDGVFGSLLASVYGLIGFTVKYFLSKISKIEARIDETDSRMRLRRETDKTEYEKIMREVIELRGKQAGASDLWQARFEMLMEQNGKEHSDIGKELQMIFDKVDTLSDCVSKLAAGGKNC